MYAMTGFPHRPHWSSFELAEAVPRRLSELYRFDAHVDGPVHAESANGDGRHARERRAYVPASSLPEMFRVD